MPDDTVTDASNTLDVLPHDVEAGCYARFVEGLTDCGIAGAADVSTPDAVSPSVAIGVSGGPDSMALAALLRRWCAEHAIALHCFIVDHNLRDGSAAEAAQVKSWLAQRGVRAEILTSTAPRPVSDIQNEARKRRYAMMLDRCRERGIRHLMVAHHRDDQAETFLLRLARGSGVYGLSAMAPSIRLGGVRLLRPLLRMPRADLHRFLDAEGWPYVQDPSNENSGFARVRLRKLMPLLAEEGLDARRLAQTADAMARAGQAIGYYVRTFIAEQVRMPESGYASLRRERLRDLPEEVGLRVLSHLMQRIGGRYYPPRIEKVTAAYRAVLEEEAFAGRTVAGSRLIVDSQDGDALIVCREGAGAASSIVPLCAQVYWDGRFVLEFDRESLDFPTLDAAGYRIGALTRDGRDWLVASLRETGEAETAAHLKRPTPAVWEAVPAIWQGDLLVAVPHIGWTRPGLEAVPRPIRYEFHGPEREHFG